MTTPSASADETLYDDGPPFVFGIGVKDGVAHEMTWELAAAGAGEYDWTWLHLNMHHAGTREWVRKQDGIPYAAQNALLAQETRPRVTSFPNGLVVNLRGVNLNEGAEPEDMISIRIWLQERRVISTRRRPLKAAVDVREELLAGPAYPSPGALVAKLAARLTTRMTPFIEEIDDKIDALEDEFIEGADQGIRGRLAGARHDAVSMRRYIAPQRDALSRLAQDDGPFFKATTRIDLRETADHVTRLREELDAMRERAMVLQDQLTDARAEEMNRNMMVLSVVAAIFLPLGFVTGLFGINVGGMPGVDDPAAFWMVVVACVVIGAGLVVLFKSLDWL